MKKLILNPNPPHDPLAEARRCVMPFGKHKGKKLGWIADNDLLYLDWLEGIDLRNDGLAECVDVLFTEYEDEIEARLDAVDELHQDLEQDARADSE